MTTPLTPEQQALVQAVAPRDETPVEAPARAIVQPVRESRLEGLLCLYSQYKSEFAEAKQKFDDLKDAITAELEGLYPDEATRPTEAYEIPASIMYPGLTWQYKESWYLPVDAIRDNLPNVYEAFKKKKSYKELREAQTGRRGGPRK